MTKDFLLDSAERAIKTFAQSLLATIAVQSASDLLAVNWLQALSIAALATVISLLTSLGSLKLGNRGTASLSTATVTTEYCDNVARGRHAAQLFDGPRD